MGVTGLWRLVEPAGKPVPVETLENKVLAVDISIWLHQVVKGYQDAKGAPLPNAHLMGLFQRLCKLLYFRIKPVFVFDGAFPELKKETIAKRQDNKAKYNSESERIKRELAVLLSKKTAIGSLLGKHVSPKKQTAESGGIDDIFKLPALPQKEVETESESESEEDSSGSVTDLHSVDIESDNFKNLSSKEKYDLLLELKETRKMNSWGKLHELPKKSDNFSDYQMQRLLKRRKVQECLQETEKEMGQSGMSFNELEQLLNEEGIDTKFDELPTRRIASNNTTRFLLIQNVKQALADMKKKKEVIKNESNEVKKSVEIVKIEPKPDTHVDCDDNDELKKAIEMSLECVDDVKEENNQTTLKNEKKKDELEEDLEKAIKMSLECTDDNNATASTSRTDESWSSFVSDSDERYSDSDEVDEYLPPEFSTAKAYIMQYSDLTHKAIDSIVATKSSNKTKSNIPSVNQIIEELQANKSVIVDNVDISSDDENYNQNNTSSQNIKLENKYKMPSTSSIKSHVDASQVLNVDDSVPEESVLCIENASEVISLDTTTEDIYQNNTVIKSIKELVEISSSEDDEFEDVPEIEIPKSKTVVQLNLNTDPPGPPEDDIFSDVFAKTPKINITDKNIVDSCVQVAVSESLVKSKKEDLNVIKIKPLQKEKQDVLKGEEIIPNVNERIKPREHEENETVEKVVEKEITTNPIGEKKSVTKPIENPITTKELNNMVEQIQNEEQDLIQEKGRLDRIGRNITEQMTREAQELLQVFGIPYIVAPMEAEAQCAFLESINLTDGTITDDSDIWLFGGRNVYKNFFNNKKNVMQFLSERIEKSFNLSREQLILLALLVGSDYTTGLSGVGPVTALEILASFPINKSKLSKEDTEQGRYKQLIAGLQEFKQWLRAGRRTDNITLKKKLKSVIVTDEFPSLRVVQAYMEPRVDKSDEKFTWGKLDITILRDYAKAKFGWSQHKLDEIIKPVLKRLADRNQKTVQDYFKRKVEFQSLEHQMSKRVKAAVQKMGPESEIITELTTEESKEPKAGTKRKNRVKLNKNSVNNHEAGPSKIKKKKVDSSSCVKVVSQVQDTSKVEIKIPKTNRVQEIIPQKEKDIQKLMQNKMKAIEVFRKTNIDMKRKVVKRKANLPKEDAELSESSDSS